MIINFKFPRINPNLSMKIIHILIQVTNEGGLLMGYGYGPYGYGSGMGPSYPGPMPLPYGGGGYGFGYALIIVLLVLLLIFGFWLFTSGSVCFDGFTMGHGLHF